MNDFILNTNITNYTNVMNMLVHEYRCIREIRVIRVLLFRCAWLHEPLARRSQLP